MKIFKKISITALLFIFTFTLTNLAELNKPAVVQAAAAKLSQSTLSLEIGQKKTLKVTGSTKKVTWTSSKKTVAAVSSKGLVTAKAAGKATITASVDGKKLTCAVTVKKPVNPYIKNAPFKAVEQTIGNISLVMPADWEMNATPTSQDSLSVNLTPKDKKLTSFVNIIITAVDDPVPSFEDMKPDILAAYSEDTIIEGYKTLLGDTPVKITDYEQSELEESFGTVAKFEFSVDISGIAMKQYAYCFIIENYYIEAVATDTNDLDLGTITEYVISSLTVK